MGGELPNCQIRYYSEWALGWISDHSLRRVRGWCCSVEVPWLGKETAVSGAIMGDLHLTIALQVVVMSKKR